MWHLEKAGTVLNTTEQILPVPDSCLMKGKTSLLDPQPQCPLPAAGSVFTVGTPALVYMEARGHLWGLGALSSSGLSGTQLGARLSSVI